MLRALILASLALCGGITAQTATDVGSDITFTLTSGETFSAQLLESNLYTVRVAHPLLGELTIARASIVEPVQLGGVSQVPVDPSADTAATEPAAEAPAAEPKPEGPQWSGMIDIAANGIGGNSDSESLFTAFGLRRESQTAIDSFRFDYRWGKAQPSDETASKANTNNKTAFLRHEWLLAESKWSPFAQAIYETDAFTSYTTRQSVAVGAGYPLIEEDKESLLVRVGVGGVREIGDPAAPETGWNAEALVGGDYRIEISETTRFEANLVVYPNLEHRGYRGNLNAHYLTALNPDGEGNPWNLKFGIENKYDSGPAPDKVPWDYYWYAGLSYVF